MGKTINAQLLHRTLTRSEGAPRSFYFDLRDGVADGMFSGTVEADGMLTAEAPADNLALRELAQIIREMGPDAP